MIAVLVRFDPVYFTLFKCFTRRLKSYPLLSAYARRVTDLIEPENMALNLDQIIQHYFTNFTSVNPNGVFPIGYKDDFLDGGQSKYLNEEKMEEKIEDNNNSTG